MSPTQVLKSLKHQKGGKSWASYIGLVGAFLVALSPELKEVEEWVEATRPNHFADYISVLGAVLVGWFSPSPVTTKD
jgi:hypothetical protein